MHEKLSMNSLMEKIVELQAEMMKLRLRQKKIVMRSVLAGVLIPLVTIPAILIAANISVTSFTSGTTISSSDMNANFSTIVDRINNMWGWDSSTKYLSYTAGNVGIGTASPDAKFHINKVDDGLEGWGMRISMVNNSSHILLSRSNSSIGYGGIFVGGTGLVFDASSNGLDWHANPLVINQDGKVGVGTGTIDTGYILQLPNISTQKAKANAWDTYACSEKWKKEIKTIPNALDRILGIKGIQFIWNKGDDMDGKPGIAVSAEDLDKLKLPTLVSKDEKGEYTGINMTGLIPVLVEAIKSLKAQGDSEIITLRNENKGLKKTVSDLSTRCTGLESRLAAIESRNGAERTAARQPESKGLLSRLFE